MANYSMSRYRNDYRDQGEGLIILLVAIVALIGAAVLIAQGLFVVFLISTPAFLGLALLSGYFQVEPLPKYFLMLFFISLVGLVISYSLGFVFGTSEAGQISIDVFKAVIEPFTKPN